MTAVSRYSLDLKACLDEPKPFVDATRDFSEHIIRVEVCQLVGLLNPLPRRLAEGC